VPKQTAAEFKPATWHIVYRSPEWVWATLHGEGLRFRREYTPYECAICLGNVQNKLELVKRNLAVLVNTRETELRRNEAFYDASLYADIAHLEGERRKLAKRVANHKLHKVQVAIQRIHNIDAVDEWLREEPHRVRVTIDYGASYFMDGTRYVNLIFWLKYVDSYGDFETECIYNCCSDPDERSEDAFFTRMVWHHVAHASHGRERLGRLRALHRN
jgi:hypothetical protein